ADLNRGRWKLDRGTYHFYEQETSHWYTSDPELQSHEQDAVPTATAVELLWEAWQRIRRGEDIAAGHRSVWILGRPVLLVWQTSSDRLIALVAGERYLEQQWFSVLRSSGPRLTCQTFSTEPSKPPFSTAHFLGHCSGLIP